MLSQSDICKILEEDFEVGKKNQINNILKALAKLAQEELQDGEDFQVPGICKIAYRYTAPRAKGEMYKKGETYVGFGGVEQTAEADSKERKASIKLVATPAAPLKRHMPKARDRAGMRKFLATKAGKTIVSRKS